MAAIYSIDTSALIHSWKRDYPPDVFPSVWEKLDALANENRLISCEEALLELERGGDDLYDWAKDRSHIFLEPGHDVQKLVANIVNKWPNFVPDSSYDGLWADPYVIAFAALRKGMVISGEKPVGSNSTRVKIPNICNELKLNWGGMLDLLRSEHYNF